MIGLTIALLAEVLRNARISMSNARRRRLQRDLIRQEMNEYEQQFPTEEHIYVHQRVGQTLDDLLAPQYEQDMEEPPRLTDAELVEEFQRIASLYWQRKVPYILVAEFPGHTNRFLSFNVESPASTTLRRAVEDLMELK